MTTPSEREVVRSFADATRNISVLKDVRVDYRLGGGKIKGLAKKWDLASLPFDLRPDLVFVFRDSPGSAAFLVAVEVKVYSTIDQASIHEGWGQASAYRLFGFDGVSLWHLFLKEPPKDAREVYHLFGEQMAASGGSGLWFFAGWLDASKLQIQTPWATQMDAPSFVKWMYQILRQSPSSLRGVRYVQDRRRAVMADLKIPS